MKKKMLIWAISLLLTVAAGYSVYKTMNSRSFQLFGEIIPRVATDQKIVALTFDDGPNKKTDEILKVLDELGIKATFFIVGKAVEDNPDELKKIVQAGHEIGNHTYSHKRMVAKPPSFIKKEIERTDQLIKEAGYQKEILFRPPYGKKLLGLPYHLKNNNKKTIMWDIEPNSIAATAQYPAQIVKHVEENVRPGSIILLHIWGYSTTDTRESVNGIVHNLREKGYKFTTVSQLIEHRGE